MLAGLPMPIRLPGVQSQVQLHIGIYVTPNEVVLGVLLQAISRATTVAEAVSRASNANANANTAHLLQPLRVRIVAEHYRQRFVVCNGDTLEAPKTPAGVERTHASCADCGRYG